jgi:hypothetical protein
MALKLLSVTAYALCAAAVLILFTLNITGFSGTEQNNLTGWLLGCTLPMFLTTLAVKRCWHFEKNPREWGMRWIMALPLAICGAYLAIIIISIIVMAMALFAVTILKMFTGGF